MVKAIIIELFIPFSFFVLAYEVTKILHNSLFTFLLFFKFSSCLSCLARRKNGTHGNENLETYFWYFGNFDEKRTYENM